MKIIVGLLAALTVASAAFAQSPQPPADQPSQEQSPPPASSPPPAPQPPRTTARPPAPPPGAQMPVRTVNQCRDDARAQHLASEQRREFMRNCRRPIADVCRKDARAKQLSGDQRRDFVRNCMGLQARAQGGGKPKPQYGVPPDDGEPMDDDDGDGAPPPSQPPQRQ